MGTSTSELKCLVYSLGLHVNFLGVYDKYFPGFLDTAKRCSAIVNTGDVTSGGVHWIAFAYDPTAAKFFMFDPFGWSKSDLLKKYQFQYERMLRNTALSGNRCVQLVKSIESVQCPCSAACGLFCVLFLASFNKYSNSPMCNNSIIDVVDGVSHKLLYTPAGIAITHANQIKLYDWLYVNSSYFRKNVVEIKNNTRINAIRVH
ncbi:protease [Siadenovirus carbocapituli]|uniref:Protease n=1 Tax=Siadenovirus sp. TaxID=2671519 RepID=A0A9E7U894_9ADEN|nr:protease [Siadenovirus sp.]